MRVVSYTTRHVFCETCEELLEEVMEDYNEGHTRSRVSLKRSWFAPRHWAEVEWVD